MSKYVDPYERKKRRSPRRRRRRRRGCLIGFLFRLLITLVVLAVIAAGALYLVPVSVWNTSDDAAMLEATGNLPAVPMQVLLIGADVLHESSQRSDALIVASIGYNSVKVTSILRDTIVEIPGHKNGKINAAFAYGGAELAMRTINRNFDMNITHYIVADFVGIVKIVDAIGGVDISISAAEMEQININVRDSRRIFKPLGYTCDELTVYGENVHLNGLQALGYARIRKIDNDQNRTLRQRNLLGAILKQITSHLYNPIMIAKLGSAVLGHLQTNLSMPALVSLGTKALMSAGHYQGLRLPLNGASYDNGSSIEITDRQKNIDAFREFVYN